MSLTLADVEKIAKLSRLTLSDDEKNSTLEKLNAVFELVEKMQTVNTDGVEPMAHPHEVALRLREDAVTESDHAAEYLAVAPEVRDRMYIVPHVIE
nr:Asp-tRNA(Asn)/Glu-tRNA(Gln) amidotransferase subunit GatC [uncultured Kingella sp.]